LISNLFLEPKNVTLDPQTKPTTAAAVVLEILRNSAEPLTRHGIFNICKGRGMYQDFSETKGANAISEILKPLEAAGQVANFGRSDRNAILWGVPGVHKDTEAAPVAVIEEAQIAVDPASEIPGTVETRPSDFIARESGIIDLEISSLNGRLAEPAPTHILNAPAETIHALFRLHFSLIELYPTLADHLLEAAEYIQAVHPPFEPTP
jgi:hypothetical protein